MEGFCTYSLLKTSFDVQKILHLLVLYEVLGKLLELTKIEMGHA